MKYLPLFAFVFLMSCLAEQEKKNTVEKKAQTISVKEEIQAPTVSTSTENIYPWLENYDINSALINRFALPEGYKRIEYPKNSMADWLRHLPLKPKGTKVLLHNGSPKYGNVHEAVVDIDTGKRDLQQCADAVMRLKAEYHYSRKEYDKIHFNFTSGDNVKFDDWRQGRKPIIKGNRVAFSAKNNAANNSYSNFKKYMIQIFTYAGTASLSKELKRISLSDIQPGDVFIQGGFPGHAITVMDVAENAEGKRIFMLSQSYMPAQDIHILKNPMNGRMSPWYDADFGASLSTPEWTFEKSDLMRFR
ncbi:MAG: DUF4846 domain-containing protein [Saprospiraceae bacterium]